MPKIRTPRLAHLIAAMFCAGASLPALPSDSHEAKPAATKKAPAEAPAASSADAKPAKPVVRAEPPQDTRESSTCLTASRGKSFICMDPGMPIHRHCG